MASGSLLAVFDAMEGCGVENLGQTLTVRNGQVVWSSVDNLSRSIDFWGLLIRAYSGLGITVRVYYAMETATSGVIVVGGQFERHDEAGTDLDADSFAAQQTASSTVPGTSGQIQTCDIAFTNAQIDGLVVGEPFRLRIQRLGNSVSDTATGNWHLYRVEVRET